MRVWVWFIFGVSVTAAVFGGLRPALGEDASQGTGTVIGTITDEKDKPVAELPLRLYIVEHASVDRAPSKQGSLLVERYRPTPLSEKLIKTVKTDAQGKFKFPDIKAGAYLLRGSRKNVGFIYQDVEVKAGKTTDLGTIKLSKP